MSIRSNINHKDHLRENAPGLALVTPIGKDELESTLRFFTTHPKKPTLVDLRVLELGQQTPLSPAAWKGPFLGRPELIMEMAPAIQDHLLPLAEKSVAQFLNALRTWWRLFDTLEAELPQEPRLTSVAQLSEIHKQRALDQGMDRLNFSNFLLLANKTRSALRIKPLFWRRPEQIVRARHLPPQWQTDIIRHELKHRWFATLARWSLAQDLLANGAPLVSRECDPDQFEAQARQLKGYQRVQQAMAASGLARPMKEDVWGDLSRDDFYKDLTVLDSFKGFYPQLKRSPYNAYCITVKLSVSG